MAEPAIRAADTVGKTIVSPRPVIRPEILRAPVMKAPAQASKSLIVQRFIINGTPIFIDPFGNVVETEEGQATGDALESQQHSLVYYATVARELRDAMSFQPPLGFLREAPKDRIPHSSDGRGVEGSRECFEGECGIKAFSRDSLWRIPHSNMAEHTPSGSFDSPSVA
ncbi:MAG TPA: hypothetical protein VI488_19020 [Candidatus Angelobacter sp.]